MKLLYGVLELDGELARYESVLVYDPTGDVPLYTEVNVTVRVESFPPDEDVNHDAVVSDQ